MSGMATWEDGPEYAPVERPSGFTQPPVEPLDATGAVAPPREPLAEAPPARPRDYAAQGDQAPLSSYQPELGPARDPGQPFDVDRSTLTEVDSAWGLVQHYHVGADEWAPAGPGFPDPRAPIQVSGAQASGVVPMPGQPEVLSESPVQSHWGPPGTGPVTQFPGTAAPAAPTPVTPAPVTFGAVFNGITVPTFATLLIGGLAIVVPFFSWLSPLMFILAFVTASQIGYRRNWVRNTFLVGSGALGATGVAGVVLSGGNLRPVLDLVTAVSTATCWIVLAALMVIVWQALSAGEQPEPPDATPPGWG